MLNYFLKLMKQNMFWFMQLLFDRYYNSTFNIIFYCDWNELLVWPYVFSVNVWHWKYARDFNACEVTLCFMFNVFLLCRVDLSFSPLTYFFRRYYAYNKSIHREEHEFTYIQLKLLRVNCNCIQQRCKS